MNTVHALLNANTVQSTYRPSITRPDQIQYCTSSRHGNNKSIHLFERRMLPFAVASILRWPVGAVLHRPTQQRNYSANQPALPCTHLHHRLMRCCTLTLTVVAHNNTSQSQRA